MRATFSIDQQTHDALRRTAERLGESKSAVIRRAVLEFEARCDRLTEAERRQQLEALRQFEETVSAGTAEAVDEELEHLRGERESGGLTR